VSSGGGGPSYLHESRLAPRAAFRDTPVLLQNSDGLSELDSGEAMRFLECMAAAGARADLFTRHE